MLANLPEGTEVSKTGSREAEKDSVSQKEHGGHAREFALLTASALWPREAGDKERVRVLAEQDLDWDIFLEMVSLHRLEPIVYHNLIEYAPEYVPPPARLILQHQASRNGMAVFTSLAEVLRLTRLFADASIDLRILKGIPLAILVYGDAGLRNQGDIDLLIAEKDILAADRLLQNAGYVRTEPEVVLTPRRFAYYISHFKDFGYRHRPAGHSVELHWRLTRNRAMPGASLARPESLSLVAAGSAKIPTLTFEDLFLYLCVHGTLDGWMRLKSLADIASLCRRMEPDVLARLAERATNLDLLPEMTAALLLANRIFSLQIASPKLLSPTDAVVRRILRFSWNAITSNDYLLPREDISGFAWARYELGLSMSISYRWEILHRVFFRPRVWSRFPLGDKLFMLYPLLSPLECLLYHMRGHSSSGPDAED